MRTVSFRDVKLPESKWHECRVCDGKGSVHMDGDLHKSAGWIPCTADGCVRGTIKFKRIYRVPEAK